MKIVVNNNEREVADGLSVAGLLEADGIGSGGTAVAVNGALVPGAKWAEHHLNDGDTLLIISAAYGG